MRALLIISLLVTFWSSLQSQGVWLDLGLNTSYGPSMLINSNIFESSRIEHNINSGWSYGGRLGVNFGDFHSINGQYNYSQLQQEFEYNGLSAPISINLIEWNTHDLMLL